MTTCKRTWLLVEYSWGPTWIPVRVMNPGAKESQVELLVKAKLPDHGWLERGDQFSVPSASLGKVPHGALVIDGLGRVRPAKSKGGR